MILMDGDDYHKYTALNIAGRLSAIMDLTRRQFKDDSVFQKLFLQQDGSHHRPMVFGPPVYPCLIETMIGFQRGYNGNGERIFTPTLTHVVLKRNEAKVIVYPKARRVHQYNREIVEGADGLFGRMEDIAKRARKDGTNMTFIKHLTSKGLIKFPVFFVAKQVTDTVIYDIATDNYTLGLSNYTFIVFDYNEAKRLVYSTKGAKDGNEKRAKKSFKAGLYGLSGVRPFDFR